MPAENELRDQPNQYERVQPAQVLLVSMPFAAVRLPALGISLLKASLAQREIACDIRYLNLPFAKRIGLLHYDLIGITGPRRFLFGERLFAHEVFSHDWGREHVLFDDIENAFSEVEFLPDFDTLLRHVRDGVGAYLDACMGTVPWDQYKIIGFSTTFEQNAASLALAKRIKATWPDKIIVFGGANCEGEMGLELHRQFPFVDFVCRGEGDDLFPHLVEGLLVGASPPRLPGLVGRHDGQSVAIGDGAPLITSLDRLPYPDYDDYFQQLHESSLDLTGQIQLLFESSRGCWYGAKQHCTFCGLNGDTMAFRNKSAGRVLDEIRYLTQRHGVNQLLATDNILDVRYLRDLIPELAERNPDWSIFYEVKANLRKEQLQVLRQAGVDRMQPGIESLSTSILKLMRKGCTALQNVQLLKWASELGVDLSWNIITGFPGEAPAEYARMAEMVPALLHLQPPQGFGAVRLDRFSPYFNNPQAFGMTNVQASSSYRMVYPFPEANLKRLAYYFDFDYTDGRNPETYTASLGEMVDYWRESYCPDTLKSVSNRHELVIYDRRPSANQAKYELTGPERAAYEFCDEAHPLQAIHKHLVKLGYAIDEKTVSRQLEVLVANRLMLRDGDWFLSLALAADDLVQTVSDSDTIKQALVEAMAELADKSRKKRAGQEVAYE